MAIISITRKDTDGNNFTQTLDFPEFIPISKLPVDESIDALKSYVKALNRASAALTAIISAVESEPLPTPEQARTMQHGYSLEDAKILEEIDRSTARRNTEILAPIIPVIVQKLSGDEAEAQEVISKLSECLREVDAFKPIPQIRQLPYRSDEAIAELVTSGLL